MAGHNVQTNISRTLNRLTVYPERCSGKAFINVLTIRSVARDMLLYTVFFCFARIMFVIVFVLNCKTLRIINNKVWLYRRCSALAVKFDESAPATNLSEELTDFAQKWDKFKNSVSDKYLLQMFDDLKEDSVGDDSPHELWDDQVVNKSKELPKSKSCKKCPVCCATLHKYSFYG